MDSLDVIELYEDSNKDKVKKFIDSAESSLKVQSEKKYVTRDVEWMNLIEEAIPHLDHVFRTPNRFIQNEEEIVKIEQARKVSVETIKHLSKNTNFIQTVDENGDVIPSKLLNVRKEETYNTYENRLAYTLIQNIKFFINKRKKSLEESLGMGKDDENKMKHVQALYGELIQNEEASRYFDAEMKFNLLIADVNRIIGETVQSLIK